MKKLLFLIPFLPSLCFGAFKTERLTVNGNATFTGSIGDGVWISTSSHFYIGQSYMYPFGLNSLRIVAPDELDLQGSEGTRIFMCDKIGINTLNTLDGGLSGGGFAWGSGYANGFLAPNNGMIVEGDFGLGTPTPLARFDANWTGSDNGSPERLSFGQSADGPTGAEGALRLDLVSNGSFGGNVDAFAINGYNNANAYLLVTSWSGSDPGTPGTRNSAILFGATASGDAVIQGPSGFSMQAFGGGPGAVTMGDLTVDGSATINTGPVSINAGPVSIDLQGIDNFDIFNGPDGSSYHLSNGHTFNIGDNSIFNVTNAQGGGIRMVMASAEPDTNGTDWTFTTGDAGTDTGGGGRGADLNINLGSGTGGNRNGQLNIDNGRAVITNPAGGVILKMISTDPVGSDAGFEVDNLTGNNANSFFFNQSNNYIGVGVGASNSYIQSSLPIYIQKPIFVGGSSNPTADVHITAGSSSANTAPLKLTTGSLNTTPEAGALEWDVTKNFGNPTWATTTSQRSAFALIGSSQVWTSSQTFTTAAATQVSISSAVIYVSSTVVLNTSQNNYVIPNTTLLKASATVAFSFTGFSATVNNSCFQIVSVGTNTITIAQDSASSANANRIWTHTAANTTLAGTAKGGASAEFCYDADVLKWRQIR